MTSSSWIGKTLGGRYQIESLLGQGGMSAVYKGSDPNLQRTVAIKLIHPHLSDNPEFIDRFRVEANVVAQLRHPNIIQVYDFNQDGQLFYMVMEFLPGETLRQVLDKLNEAGKSMSLVQLMKFASNVCEAADYAHQRNVIHRDIKPANVLLDPQGRAVLMDFGIAKIMGGPKYTATGATMGTALYMPPEQIRGDHVDARSDIYAIGVMLFEMIAGRAPFQAVSPMTVLMMHIEDPLPDLSQLRPNCPADLKTIVEKAMAKDPADRYQSAAAMNADLTQALTALQSSLHAPTAAAMAVVAATAQPRVPQPPTGVSPYGAPDQTYQSAPATAGATSPSAPPPLYTPPVVVTSGGNKSKRLLLLALLLIAGFVLVGGLFLALFLLTRPDEEAGTVLAGVELTGTAQVNNPDAGIETPVIESLATETPVLEVTQEPDASPTTGPTPTLEPTATPTPEPVGLLLFSDNDQVRAGSFSLAIPAVAPPAAGFHHELWFSDGLDDVSMAVIEPGSDISMTVEGEENLLAAYDRALITEEPDGQSGEGPVGETIFLGFLPPAALEPIRLLLVTAPEPPGQQAYLVGAEEQARLASDHGGFLADSLASGNLAGARQHAEHVVNILSGQENPAFGDLNGDGQAQNPGNGFGVIAYLELAREQIVLAAAPDDDGSGVGGAELASNAEPAILALDNAQAFLEEAIQAAGRVLASDSVDEAQLSEQALNDALAALLDGRDGDGDDLISPEAGEGGLLLAYQQVLKMGAFEFFNAQDVAADSQ